MRSLYFLFIFGIFSITTIIAKGNLFVQSPKAKLLAEPQLSSNGSVLKIGDSLSPINEQGLFVQVRVDEKTGWVSKLFVSPLPPSSQIKLGSSSSSSESVAARQRASDFTKTAAARGLSETEKLRVRGGAELYDFESLRWLESLPIAEETQKPNGSDLKVKENKSTISSNNKAVSAETKAEVKMGRSLAARLLKKYALVKNRPFTQYLNRVGGRITSVSSRPELSFKFGVLDTEEVNAFACPGGFIFLTKGTIKSIKNESELAGVLGHEIGHVVLFHSGEFKQTNVFLDILSSLLSPSGGEVINAAASTALDEMEKQLFETGRDASVEWEADEAGVGLATQAGYAVDGLGNYLITLSKLGNTEIQKKTHPDTSTRIAKLIKVEASVNNKSIILHQDMWNQNKDLLSK
ncbi:MAG: M48 family metalloprotease [Leptospira sp.]|nr:M48 family metalloprotease [Leptospira sp.]